MKVALVYDRVNKWGGAERVLLALHDIFKNAPLYTSVYNSGKAKWAKDFRINTSFLQKVPKASSSHEFLGALMPIAFESFSFDEYDLVISVTSEAAKGIITKPQTLHVCYCLTPTRYLWSGYDFYFKNKVFRFITSPFVRYLRRWEKVAKDRPDEFIAISEEVKRRIKKFYQRDSVVIYPPVKIPKNPPKKGKEGKYFLVASRLNDYKRIDIAIEACNKLNLPLKIIGKGPEYKRLIRLAGSTVEFLGEVSDKDLEEYYRNCKALIFPGLEDFGLVMVEAQSFGRPVIAYRGGGAMEIVKEGVTGEFFNEQTPRSLIDMLKTFDENSYNSLSCWENSKRFDYEKFRVGLIGFLNKKMGQKI